MFVIHVLISHACTGILAEWLTQRNVTQRSAIRSIEPNYHDLCHYLYGSYHGSFGKDLPALEEVYVWNVAFNRPEVRIRITDKIRQKDGQGVRIIVRTESC
jgi:hypothetical protein